MANKFELYKDAAGEWRFRLKANNGEIVAVSEGYSSKSAAVKGIDAIRNIANESIIEEVEN